METNLKHVMVDLETLGTATDSAAVISVAAVRFDLRGGDIDTANVFHRNIDLSDALTYGRVDAGTLKWWLGTDRRDIFFDIVYDKEARKMRTVLEELYSWVTLNKGVIPWARGIDFDFGLLDRLYRETGAQNPFSQFWKRRDLRTLIDVARHAGVPLLEVERDTTQAHNALADVIHQSREAIAYSAALRGLTGIDG
ncbi:MAG: 3'-5' exonuclease [Thiohalomonadaceae bacterium]